jgi:hypothetical protein
VLVFSKSSDMSLCHLSCDLRDETVSSRFEKAILDYPDTVDFYLADR